MIRAGNLCLLVVVMVVPALATRGRKCRAVLDLSAASLKIAGRGIMRSRKKKQLGSSIRSQFSNKDYLSPLSLLLLTALDS